MSFFKNTKVTTNKSFSDNSDSSDSSDDSDHEDSSESDDSGDEKIEKIEETEDVAVLHDNIITVFGNRNGKRTNTYIVGLNITDEIRKSYLKSLKTKYACNGSIKVIKYNNIDETSIHLQGDQIQNVKAFLLKEKVNQPINIKLIE